MDTDQLDQLIHQKHQVLMQLRDLSRQQLALISAGEDMVPLLTVLSAKQRLMDQLTLLERKLDPFRDQDPETRKWRSPADRQRCALAAERCRSLLNETMLLEKQGVADLTRRRNETAARHKASSSAVLASAAYAGHATGQDGHLDLTSES